MVLSGNKRAEFEAMFATLVSEDSETISRAMFSFVNPLNEAMSALNRYKARVAHALETKDVVFGLAAVAAYQDEIAEMSGDESVARRFPGDRFGKMLGVALHQASRGKTSDRNAGQDGWIAAAWVKDIKEFLAERLAAGDVAMMDAAAGDTAEDAVRDLASLAWSTYDFGDVTVEDADGWESEWAGNGIAEFTRVFYIPDGGGTARCSFAVRVDPVAMEVVDAVAYDHSGNPFGTVLMEGSVPAP